MLLASTKRVLLLLVIAALLAGPAVGDDDAVSIAPPSDAAGPADADADADDAVRDASGDGPPDGQAAGGGAASAASSSRRTAAIDVNPESRTPVVVVATAAAPKAAFVRKASARSSSSSSSRGAAAAPRGDIFARAFDKAIGGGVPGAIAGIVQVLSLMWLRTVINYQYRYGSTFLQALTTLYGMGGIPRLYSGLSFALIQAPLARFVSTAANDGVGVLLQGMNWGPGREVIVAALVVGAFRVVLMPIDTCKTVLQIESTRGLARLMARVRGGDVHLLYSGALANAAASFVGHYPWFYVYNLLSGNGALREAMPWATGRNALIGFISSIISDTVSNFIRVIKTTKQAMGSTRSRTSYAEVISLVLAADGWWGLFGRGLKTRILGNALQSILFTVVWRGLSERWQEGKDADAVNDEDPSSDAVDAKGA